MDVDIERQLIVALFSKFADRIQVDDSGYVTMEGPQWDPVATLTILRSVQPNVGPLRAMEAYQGLRTFIETADRETLRDASLSIVPPRSLHFIDAGDQLFYDFVNTDRTLSELLRSGARLQGNILDFGCSTGRNVAVVQRANFHDLAVFGCDPVPSSIEWAQQNIPVAQLSVSQQEPPLPYGDEMFDLGYAKSIWTHFSPRAARAWMDEIARVLKPGGRFFFSVHGPHDVANRLIFNFPKPHYPSIGNGEFPDRTPFLVAVVSGLRKDGFFFRPYTDAGTQPDLRKLEGATTTDWGLTFVTTEYLTDCIIPANLELIRYTPAATAGRLDGCVVRKR